MDSPKEARSLDNFQKLQWLPIDKICEIGKLSLFRKIIDGRAPEYLIHKLESFRFNHKCRTRSQTEYRLPKPRTDSLRRIFFYTMINTWNTLGSVRQEPLRVVMKLKLTNDSLAQYTVDNFRTHKSY